MLSNFIIDNNKKMKFHNLMLMILVAGVHVRVQVRLFSPWLAESLGLDSRRLEKIASFVELAVPRTRGKRGSISFQAERTQECWGTSVHASTCALPARKFK